MARSNVNICLFSGNLTRNPEVKISASGSKYARFTIASNDEAYDTAVGDYVGIVNFIDCIAFGEIADRVEKQYRKGSRIMVEAKLVQQVMHDEKCNRNRRYSVYRVTNVDGDEPGRDIRDDIVEREAWSSSIWMQ